LPYPDDLTIMNFHMLIRCWGARGSIPVSGREYLKYGGDTTCIEVRSRNNKIIIVDAGSGIRRLGNHLLQKEKLECSIIFTHSHWDHILGFPFFRPIYSSRTKLHLYGCPFAQKSVKRIISSTMTAPNFPVQYSKINATITYHGICDLPFMFDTIRISPILLSHPNQGNGYKFEENGKSFVFLTDNELMYHHRGGRTYGEYVKFCQNADVLIHDAEFTPAEYKRTRMWGHTAYPDALRLAMDAKVKVFGLYHHNQNRSDKELDGIVKKCRETIRKNNLRITCLALTQNSEFKL
jgi:ribonuclease BN (tRNA processing enzyme)